MYTAACKHNWHATGLGPLPQQANAQLTAAWYALQRLCLGQHVRLQHLPSVCSRCNITSGGGGEGHIRGFAEQAEACILFRILVAVQNSSAPPVAVAWACAQPCAWPCAWPAAKATTAETAAAATHMMRSSRRRARKCVVQWRPPCPRGKRRQQNTLRADTEGKGVVWISECPDSSVMERSPERPFLGAHSTERESVERFVWGLHTFTSSRVFEGSPSWSRMALLH
eukprot:358281-Chlamydomonas_euryale.AAC.2